MGTFHAVRTVFDTRGDFTSWHDSDLAGQHDMLVDLDLSVGRILARRPMAAAVLQAREDIHLALAWVEEEQFMREEEREAMHVAVFAPRWLESIPQRFGVAAILN